MPQAVSQQRPRSGWRNHVILFLVMLGGTVPVFLVGRAVLNNWNGEKRVVFARMSVRTLKSALDAYKIDVGNYPSQDIGLKALIEPPSEERAARLWKGPYMDVDKIPRDPWGNEFVYVVPKEGDGPFELISLGGDGTRGGEGQDADISSRDLAREHRR